MVAIGSSRLPFFLFYALLHVVTFTISQPDFFYHLCLSENGNYTTNSPYQANLNSLLSSISSNSEISYGFYNFSAGQGSNKVNAIALCRKDINLDVCRSCVNDSISKLTQLCPYRKEAIGWYDTCMLRYSNRDIFHIMDAETSHRYYLCNPNNVLSLDQFNQVLENLLDGLRSNASSGGSLGKEKITEAIHHCLAPFVKESLQFDLGTIRAATDNFSEAKKLGQGGFGVVYKGTLPDGQQVAVKRLFMISKQGDVEFKNEVTLVARLQAIYQYRKTNLSYRAYLSI